MSKRQQRAGGREQEQAAGGRSRRQAVKRVLSAALYCLPPAPAACRLLSAACRLLLLSAACCLLSAAAPAQSEIGRYDGRVISAVEIVFDGTPPDETAEKDLRALLKLNPGTEYAAVRVRQALQDLQDSKLVLVAAARVEIVENGRAGLTVRFVVRRERRVSDIIFNAVIPKGAPVSVEEMRGRLVALEPGGRLSDKLLENNADALQEYLRERGFFRAEVEHKHDPDPRDSTGVRERVRFDITLGPPALVESFTVTIIGFDAAKLAQAQSRFRLKKGAPYSREALLADVQRLRQALIAEGYLSPLLGDPQPEYDAAKNHIKLSLQGRVGPQVQVKLEDLKLSEKTLRALLPVKREGTIDVSAIEEGARRLRNKLQLDGYFFAEVNAVCAVTPSRPEDPAPNETKEACVFLSAEDVADRNVTITYQIEKGRRLKLTEVRIVGTDKLTVPDIAPELRTEIANPLAFVSLLGSRRGYTTKELLEQDRQLVEARIRDLGYRKAAVSVRQGVSLQGETLIITFAIKENPLTRVAEVQFRGNTVFNEFDLRAAVARAGQERCVARETALLQGRSVDTLPCYPTIVGGPYSPSQARADSDAVQQIYAQAGYFDARVEMGIETAAKSPIGDEQIKLIYTVRNEGKRVVINDITVNGTQRAKPAFVLRALPLRSGDVLRADRLTESERILYGTDAFRQVNIRTRAVGERPDGTQLRDVILDLEEDKQRRLEYGGGFNTDTGPFGFVSLSSVNAFGKLQQVSARTRLSQRQQLLRLDFLDPRWRPYGENRFMPLSISAQYQRDSTVTRFFRSTVDRGNFGIVQRLDENGNPIDEFGNPTGVPTVNRFTFNVETQRILDGKARNILLLRYAYEDVRLYNIGSLIIADLLRPDRTVRLSRFGGSFYRDTRDNQFEPTKGEYLTADYAVSLRQLGANTAFNKLLLNYRRYYRVKRARNTIIAGNITLGVAGIFNPRDRRGNGLDEEDLQLPISERFFGGGSTTLRGFSFEEAGPRLVFPDCYRHIPDQTQEQRNECGKFRDQRGQEIRLNPFTVPIGGNALAVLNLEARVPLRKEVQVVPFYDGGNVYRRVSDIFRRQAAPGADPNLTQRWTHTVGLGLRVKTPLGGSLAVDYGFLLNPPTFLIPQRLLTAPDASFRLNNSQLHFRFTQAF